MTVVFQGPRTSSRKEHAALRAATNLPLETVQLTPAEVREFYSGREAAKCKDKEPV